MSNPRQAAYPVNPMFTNRWSPRALTGEAITREQLFTVLEAARWAPSAYNVQPWRFIYALRDTAQWDPIFNGLREGNRTWVKDGSALVVLASAKNAQFPGAAAAGPNAWHSFDTGAAWISMAFQAMQMGLTAHALAGFEPDQIRAATALPEDYAIDAVIVIGKQGDKSKLPEVFQQREAPNDRRPLTASAMEGKFSA
jgi:nitroreductase